MPRYLIEEPNPFAEFEEWVSFRAMLSRLPQSDPDVIEAIQRADEAMREIQLSEPQDAGHGGGSVEPMRSARLQSCA